MTDAQHNHGGQHREAHGFLPPVLVPTPGGRTQSPARLQLPVPPLDRPTCSLEAHPWTRRQLGPSGHQAGGRLGAPVTPLLAPYHSDGTSMTPPQAGARRPKRVAAFPPRCAGPAGAWLIWVWHLGHELFERCILHGLPGPGDGTDQAPAAGRLGLRPGLDPVHMGLGTRGRLTPYDAQLGPTRGPTRAHQLATQRVFAALRRGPRGQHAAPAPR
jgi:hypothetical protein